MRLYQKLNLLISQFVEGSISKERKEVLQPMVNYVQAKALDRQSINLNFICTHNSRRSHLAQIWAQTMASYFGIPHVYCYSGGTEVTEINPQVIKTMIEMGFDIHAIANTQNSIYSIKYADNAPPVIAFSKTYNDPFNPKSSFAAIMTCTDADEHCPHIAGAALRVATAYEDPKLYDATPVQASKYHERSIQVAQEMFYVFSQVNK